MNKFVNVDYYNTARLLSKDGIMMVRDSVRKFVDNKIIPIKEKQYRREKFRYLNCIKTNKSTRVMHKFIFGDDIIGFFARERENEIETTQCGLFCI